MGAIMALRPRKPCAFRGCPKLTRSTYCEDHVGQQAEETKYYNKHVRDKTKNSFYSSYDWQKTRDFIKNRDMGLCQECLRNGRVNMGDIVHHIIPYEIAPERAHDITNLEYVCHGCHNKVHGEMRANK